MCTHEDRGVCRWNSRLRRAGLSTPAVVNRTRALRALRENAQNVLIFLQLAKGETGIVDINRRPLRCRLLRSWLPSLSASPMFQDLRFAFRQLGRHRWFSAAIVITLALGIGINTTVFTLVNAVLFKPVPVPGGERLVAVIQQNAKNPGMRAPLSLPEYRMIREQTTVFTSLEGVSRDMAILGEPGLPPERYQLGYVTTGLFKMLSTQPILGRGFAAADGAAGAPMVVMLGHSVWQKRYGGAADVLGRTVRINGQPATIIGVMPEGFQFPDTEDIWAAYAPTKEREAIGRYELMLFGMLKPGASISEANGQLALISTRLAKDLPDTDKELVAHAQSFHDQFNGGPIKLIFLLMLGAVGFVLLIACANVANMMLSRALARGRELAVRVAVGASRWQIIRQMLVESVLLSMLGGLLGLWLSTFGVKAFDLATRDVGKPYWIMFTMDWRAFAYFGVISVASGLIFGLLPALRASRADLNTTLKEGTSGAGGHGGRLTAALVVFQFAATVVLLAGAGLMIRNFIAVQQINSFVPAKEILGARILLPDRQGDRYETPQARKEMHRKLLERLAALPGVDQAVLTSDFPGLGSQTRDVEIEGRKNPDPKQPYRMSVNFSSPGYLPAINLPILTGRGFNDTDGETGKEAAVVTREFASRYWPSESPIGHRFRMTGWGQKEPGPWVTVVGVCGDIIQSPQERHSPPLAYMTNRQEPWAWLGLMLRTKGDPAVMGKALRSAVQEIDPDLPLFELRTLPEAIAHENWFIAVFGSLFFVFAIIALLMASVGIYAVVAQNTAWRTREIGIRMALGATTGRVVRLMLTRGMRQLAYGLCIGIAGALASTRLMESLVGLVSPTDPLVFGSITVLLGAIGLFACWLPARRAARVSPTEALRAE